MSSDSFKDNVPTNYLLTDHIYIYIYIIINKYTLDRYIFFSWNIDCDPGFPQSIYSIN